jgi:tetratricopeptide (TPR) repeat protein
MDKHVFISYQHDDNDFAEALIHRVEKEGFTPWIDQDSLSPGEDWREGIDQAIREAFALIVIMSPSARASEYVTYEWVFAWGCGIKVIPVMFKYTSLHPRLKSLQYLDFTNRSARPWGELMKALQGAASQTATSSNLTQQRAQEWIEKGEMFLKCKDCDGALEAFKRAILLDPGSARAYTGKSTALHGLERHKEALIASEQALRLAPRYPPAWNARGDALDGRKRHLDALAAFEQALIIDPHYALAWTNKGHVLFMLNRHEEALTAYEQAIRLEPYHATHFYNKGKALYCLKYYEEALTMYEQAIKLDATDIDFWNNKGTTLELLGRSHEAKQCYRKARELDYKNQISLIG